MKRTQFKQIFKNISDFGGKEVTVGGWIRTLRDSKAFGFIELNDGSFFKNCQIVLSVLSGVRVHFSTENFGL